MCPFCIFLSIPTFFCTAFPFLLLVHLHVFLSLLLLLYVKLVPSLEFFLSYIYHFSLPLFTLVSLTVVSFAHAIVIILFLLFLHYVKTVPYPPFFRLSAHFLSVFLSPLCFTVSFLHPPYRCTSLPSSFLFSLLRYISPSSLPVRSSIDPSISVADPTYIPLLLLNLAGLSSFLSTFLASLIYVKAVASLTFFRSSISVTPVSWFFFLIRLLFYYRVSPFPSNGTLKLLRG